MNLSINGLNGFSVFSQRFGTAGMLKSTQDRLERQQKAQSQIDFFENQKANLKNIQCNSIEDIARKLEMFHSYEEQIAAVKKQYNNEQMFNTMDEAITEESETIRNSFVFKVASKKCMMYIRMHCLPVCFRIKGR